MSDRQEKWLYLLISLNAIAFVAIFLSVGFNNRLAADDLHYLVKSKELGIWDAMLFYYNNWNPRWSATLVTNAFLGNYNESVTFPLFHISTLLLGVLSIFSTLKGIKTKLELPFTTPQIALLSIYILGAIFYGSFAKDDTWFWLTVTPMYLWGSFAAVLGGSMMLHNWNRLLRMIIAASLFLYAGGASETVAISSITVLFYLGFITYDKEGTTKIDRSVLHVATISCLIGFGIDLAGSGAAIRYDHLPQYSFGDKVIVGFWNYFKFTFKEIPLTLPVIILFASPLAYFGRKQLTFQVTSLRDVIWNNRKLWGIADILIGLLAFVLAFVMGEMGPTRAWVPLTFITVAIALVVAYQLGSWVYLKTNGKLFHLAVIAQLILLGFQFWSGFRQITTTRIYANAVDARMERINLGLKRNTEFILLDPLPESGWLFSSEITNDTAHYRNRHLNLYFENESRIILKEGVTSTPQ